MRLSQIDQAEVRMLEELKKEREKLLNRLHKLESDERSDDESYASRRPKGDIHTLRETVVLYLRERKEPVRGVEIQRFVEQATGRRISNMSSFMKALEPEYDRVERLGRGLYIYRYGIE